MAESDELCRQPSERPELEACCRPFEHDGPHRFWTGANVAGGRKCVIWLYEPNPDGSGFIVAGHADFEGTFSEDNAVFASFLIDAAAERRAAKENGV